MRKQFAESRKAREYDGGHGAKYGPGKDPLEMESQLEEIKAPSSLVRKRMLEIVNKMIADPRLAGAGNTAVRKALVMWKTNLSTEGIADAVNQEFLRDFWEWMLGRGKEADHKKTPWYRQSLADDNEVAAYVDMFVTKMHEFRMKLRLLSMRRPIGINQVFLYYKYVIKGEKPDESNFLKDWSVLQDEFNEARAAPYNQDWRDPSTFQAHETAPYNDPRKRLADARQQENENQQGNQLIADVINAPQPGGNQASAPADAPPPPAGAPPDVQNVNNGPVDMDQMDAPAGGDVAAALEKGFDEILKKIQIPDVQNDRAIAVALEARREAERLGRENEELKRRMEALNGSAIPPKEKEEASETDNRIARLVEIAEASQQEAERLREAINLGRIERTRQNKALFEALSSQSQNFADMRADSKRMIDSNAERLSELQEALSQGLNNPGPVIEEMETIMNGLQEASNAIKASNDAILLLGEASEAEKQQRAAEIALMKQANQQRDEFLKAFQNSQKQRENQLLEKQTEMLKGMAGMIEATRKNNPMNVITKQNEFLNDMIQKLPAANTAAFMDFYRNIQMANAESLNALKKIGGLVQAGTEQNNAILKNVQNNSETAAQMAASHQALLQMLSEQQDRLRIANEAFNDDPFTVEMQDVSQKVEQTAQAAKSANKGMSSQAKMMAGIAKGMDDEERRRRAAGARDAEKLFQEFSEKASAIGQFYGVEPMQQDEEDMAEAQFDEPGEEMDMGSTEELVDSEATEELVDEEKQPTAENTTSIEADVPSMTYADFQNLLTKIRKETAEDKQNDYVSVEMANGETITLAQYDEDKIDNMSPLEKKAWQELVLLENQFMYLLAHYNLPPPSNETRGFLQTKSMKRPVIERKITEITGYINKVVRPAFMGE